MRALHLWLFLMGFLGIQEVFGMEKEFQPDGVGGSKPNYVIVQRATDIPSLRDYYTPDCLEAVRETEKWMDKPAGKVSIVAPVVVLAAPVLWQGMQHLTPLQMVGAMGISWLLADLESGLLHVFLDNMDGHNTKWPVDMRAMAQEFQWHHDYPSESAKLPYWECARHGRVVALPLLIMALPFHYYGFYFTSFVLSTAGFLGFQVPFIHHRLTHGPYARNGIVKTLRKLRLIDTPASHNLHHSHPTRSVHYCLFNGHTNFIVDPLIAVARRSYAFFRQCCGARPPKED